MSIFIYPTNGVIGGDANVHDQQDSLGSGSQRLLLISIFSSITTGDNKREGNYYRLTTRLDRYFFFLMLYSGFQCLFLS